MAVNTPKTRWSLQRQPSGNSKLNGYICGSNYEALLISEPHFRLPNGSWSGGGPFYKASRKIENVNGMAFPYLWNGRRTLDVYNVGGAGPRKAVEVPYIPPLWTSQKAVLDGKYATGYKRARPGNPVGGLGQFLVELRDLPKMPLRGVLDKARGVSIKQAPRFLLERLNDYRSLGSEYLNVQFGWKPFVDDVRKLYELWHTIDSRMAKIVKENGRFIRRKATVSNETTTGQTQESKDYAYYQVGGAPPGNVGLFGRTVYSVTSKTTERVWFVGSFRYYIPDVSSSQWDKRARAALFGALPTPELLWNVLPWSWLIDWFGNVGDVVSNASPNAVDNLTMRYSFIMRQVTQRTEYVAQVFHRGFSNADAVWPGVDQAFKTIETVETKARVGGGNPFGLNVQLPSLTAYQLSILAALGISRSTVR